MYKVIFNELKKAGALWSHKYNTFFFEVDNYKVMALVNQYNLTVQKDDLSGMYWLLDILN